MKEPKLCIIRKYFWGVHLTILIVMVILSFINYGEENFGIFCGIAFLEVPFLFIYTVFAFEPQFEKMRMEKELYIKYHNKHLEEEYYSLDADINHRATKKMARSYKEGWLLEKCPKCGKVLEANENFCVNCGVELYFKCPKCKNVNNYGDDYCRSCGKKFEK